MDPDSAFEVPRGVAAVPHSILRVHGANQVMQALGNLKWLAVMDPLPTTSSEFWRRPGVAPAR
jgi:hypothetical protein